MLQPKYLPPSANGQAMISHEEDASYYLVAGWRAPFFIYHGEGLLFHCEDKEQFDSIRTGKRFDAEFNQLERQVTV